MEPTELKKVGTFEQYKLNNFKDLDNKLLSRLHKDWPAGATHAVFTFAEPIKNEWLVSKPLLSKYNVAIIYSAQPSQIKVKKVALPETLTSGCLPQAKMMRLFLEGSKETVKKIKKLGPAFKKEIRLAVVLMKKSRHVSLFKDGKPVTLSAIVKRRNYLGEYCDWILWGWADKGLSISESVAENEYFWGLWKKSRLPVELKTRSFMPGNQKLARSRGFTPKYVTVAKMA
ncbi:MAG: hypothetical protein Q7R35_18745 [Elusimicrobiota bacterium]|nr:hypothetical protein [Elusimicrobiota bacterium]